MFYFSVAPKISHNRIQRAVPPEQLTEQSANCERFVVGDPEKRMLYSPLYDNNYPTNTDCVVVLEGKQFIVLSVGFCLQNYN